MPPAADAEERVLAAALGLLARDGYAAVTRHALAPRAGVAKTTILCRWGSTAAVAVAAVERLALHVGLPKSGTPRGDLNAQQGRGSPYSPTAKAASSRA